MQNLLDKLQKIKIIFALTFKEAVRRRLILVLTGGCILFMGSGAGCLNACRGLLQQGQDLQKNQIQSSLAERGLTDQEIQEQMKTLGTDEKKIETIAGKQLKRFILGGSFTMISFWLFLIAGIFTPFLAMNDFQTRTHVLLLSRPVRRWQYLTGKFFAIFAILLVNALLLLLSFHIFFYISFDEFGSEILRGFPIQAELLMLFVTMLMLLSLVLGRIAAIFISLLVLGLTILPGFLLVSDQLPNIAASSRAILMALAYGLPQFGANFFYALGEVIDIPGVGENILKNAGNHAGYWSLFINLGWLAAFWCGLLFLFEKQDMDT